MKCEMKCIIQFEFSGPFRFRPKVEWFSSMKRVIWLWFSVAYYQCNINDLKSVFADAWREDEFEIDEELISRLRS